MREIRYYRYLQYFDAEKEKYVTYKRVKEYKFEAIIPVEGTIREKSYFDSEYDYKKDPRKYYFVKLQMKEITGIQILIMCIIAGVISQVQSFHMENYL